MKTPAILLFFSIIPLAFISGQTLFDDFPSEISVQYGPETGFSLLMPKAAARTSPEGWYYGVAFSTNLVSVFTFTIAPVGGYRKQGFSADVSLAYTFVSGQRDGGKDPRGHFLNLNPKVMLGHRVFAGFGPSFYLVRSKKQTNSAWDDLGKYNFELGYSNRLRF